MDLQQFQIYSRQALSELQAIHEVSQLPHWHHAHLGKSGALTNWKKGIGQCPAEQRKAYGQAINQVAEELEKEFFNKQEQLKLQALVSAMQQQSIDPTLPGRPRPIGGLHPSTLMLREICTILQSLGFSVYESRHIETDEYNFQLLNIPASHPARDMQDTFFIDEQWVLRTHTSPGQIHAMREFAPLPLQMILPGLCYRNEDMSARSEIQFHQVEGIWIGEQVRFSDLKGVLLQFAKRLFGAHQQIRLRASYFPFTEPSVEVDVLCTLCEGKGCRVCKHTGWLEFVGAGMIHPQVLIHGGYDPQQTSGFAFGLGVERLTLMRYQIEDIRLIFQNDLRFLQQL